MYTHMYMCVCVYVCPFPRLFFNCLETLKTKKKTESPGIAVSRSDFWRRIKEKMTSLRSRPAPSPLPPSPALMHITHPFSTRIYIYIYTRTVLFHIGPPWSIWLEQLRLLFL